MRKQLLIVLVVMWACALPGMAQVMLQRPMTLIGSLSDITVAAQDSARANREIDRAVEEISGIETLNSEWQPGTQVSEVNSNAGTRPVKVDREVFELPTGSAGSQSVPRIWDK